MQGVDPIRDPTAESGGDAVAAVILRRLVVETGADMAYFHLGDSLRVVAGPDPDADWSADAEYWRPLTWSEIPAEAGYAGGLPFTFDLATTDPLSAAILRGAPTPIESVLSVPLSNDQGRVVGGLDLTSRSARVWSDSDRRAALAIADFLLLWFDWALAADVRAHVEEVGVRRAEALTTCARALLANRGDDALQEALDAIKAATDAGLVFVERNHLTADGRLLTRTVRHSPLICPDGDRWDEVDWDVFPRIRSELESGQVHLARIDRLPLPDRAGYEGSWIASEINVPIFIEGKWVGLIGSADANPERSWSGDRRLLEVAAAMIGAFWANQGVDEELRRRGVREQALGAFARILLSGEDDALERGLAEVVKATSAAVCFVERNAWDPVLGLVSEVMAAYPREGNVYRPDHWDRRPWSTMPDSYRHLSRGELFHVDLSRLGPVEAETYAGSGVGAEIDVPILVRDEWQGLLAIASGEPREFSPEEVDVLTAAAVIVGAFWDRQDRMEELREVARSKDRFLSSVSHEVRTPLTAVVGLAEILRSAFDEEGDTQKLELASLIAEQGFEMANIIEDLLVAGRMEIDAVSVVLEEVDLLEQIELAMRGVNGASNVMVERQHVRALADPVRLRQIVRNLVTNALRYGGDTVLLTIEEAGPGHAVVSVGDNGVGIRAADTNRIFEPYQRAGDAPSTAGSVGIGLAVSRHLARKMGGDLVYRRKDGWTRFEFTLKTPTGV
jgi:signal transduction histidine kinase